MTQQITSRINRDCQCMLNAAYITEFRFSCDPQEGGHVIYRAQLSSTPSVSSTDLIRLLQEWVTSGSASVTLDFIQLYMDPTCSVMINLLDDPICPAAATTSTPPIITKESTSNYLLPILIVVIILIVVMLISCTAIIILILRNKNSTKHHPRLRSVLLVYHST